jgi:hypothetical protein
MPMHQPWPRNFVNALARGRGHGNRKLLYEQSNTWEFFASAGTGGGFLGFR